MKIFKSFKKISVLSIIIGGGILLSSTVYGQSQSQSFTIKEMILGEFYSVRQFSEGLGAATYKKDGKWGFIDKKGKTTIPFVYDFVGDFKNNRAIVKQNDKYGFIDKEGKMITPIIYDDVSEFKNNFAVVWKNNKWGYINYTGGEITPIIYDNPFYAATKHDSINSSYLILDYYVQENELMAKVYKDKKYGLIDNTGKEILPIIYHELKPFEEEWAKMQVSRVDEGLSDIPQYGFVNREGEHVFDSPEAELKIYRYIDLYGLKDSDENKVVEPKYNIINQPEDGMRVVGLSDGHTTKYGYLNEKGEEIIPPIYDRADPFDQDVAIVCLETKNGYEFGTIDKSGKILAPIKYSFIGPFINGLAIVDSQNGRGCIDISGKEVIPSVYFWVGSDVTPRQEFIEVISYGDGFAKHGYFDRNGKEIVPLLYSNVYNFSDGLVKATKEEIGSYVDKKGQLVTFTKNERIHYIDRSGNIVINIDARKFETGNYKDGLIEIYEHGKMSTLGFMNKRGEIVVPMQYDRIHSEAEFKDGMIVVKKSGKYILLEKIFK